MLIALILTIFGIFVYFAFLKSRKTLSPSDKQFVRAKWNEHKENYKEDPTRLIFEGDKLIEYILKRYGFVGTYSENLNKAEKIFRNPEKVWATHKIRNLIIHDVNFKIDAKMSDNAIASLDYEINALTKIK